MASPRTVMNVDFDWRFCMGDHADWATPEFDDSDWRILDLPHDWSIEGAYSRDNPSGTQCGFLPTGVAWYRKELVLAEVDDATRFELQVDAIYMNSEVWCNGHYLGKRPYGYISIHHELTPWLKSGRNLIAVRVDTSLQPSSRWYNGSGIYGHVNLLQTGLVRIPTWGLRVTTPAVSEGEARVEIETRVESKRSATLRVENVILSPSGENVQSVSSTCQLDGHDDTVVNQVCNVSQPQRWSPDLPALYRLRTEVWEGDTLLDEAMTTFGIRKVSVDADRGFILNGTPLKLKGVCNHHDAGLVGAAVPEKVLERRVRMLKAMGCNTIRTAHNPHLPAFYAICDRLGMMVMDEIFDGWKEKGEQDYGKLFFKEWWQRDVEDWVCRDRNHACVVMWSIGNETGIHDEHNISGFIRRFDDSRPITGGDVHSGVDVSGFNGKAEMPDFLESFKKEHPDQPVVLTEVPHTYQTRGFYRVLTWWRDINQPRFDIPSLGDKQIFFDGHMKFSSSYDNSGIRLCARSSWKRTQAHDWIMGEFRWTGFDYLGETFPGAGWPTRFWSHGIIDLCGFPKDHYYLYQSFWTSSPMVHVLPHWTHRGMDGTIIPVVAYSNCETVELFLNGVSLGVQARGDLLDFQWQVPYQPGELKAFAYRDGKVVAETVRRTAGNPVSLQLETDNAHLECDRRDIAHVTFSACDASGTLVPWANDPVHFDVRGPVRLLGFENGNHLDLTPHRVLHRDLFHGLGLGIFQATEDTGDVEITAASILGDSVFCDSTAVTIASARLALRGELESVDIALHYTLDGTEPTIDSPRAEGTIELTESATVRVLLTRDGVPAMRFVREFVRGQREPVTDPRLLLPNGKSSVEVEGFVGPFAAQLVGTWRLWRRRLQFRPDGTVVEAFRRDGRPAREDDAVAGESVTAYWWYDYPQDIF
jgi:beta-galactosidase